MYNSKLLGKIAGVKCYTYPFYAECDDHNHRNQCWKSSIFIYKIFIFKNIVSLKSYIMQAPDPYQLLHQANHSFQIAMKESNRAKEDLVTHTICSHSRNAIKNYMMGFILMNHNEIPNPATIDNLHNTCKHIDPKFNLLDISDIQCRYDAQDKKYCLDHITVNKCFKTAENVKRMVF